MTHVKKCVDIEVYDPEILNWYDKKDFDRMENWINMKEIMTLLMQV